jgi:hypothetical protein
MAHVLGTIRRLIATIDDPAVIQKILDRLGLPGAREDPGSPLPLTAAGAEQPALPGLTVYAVPGSGQPRTSALPVPDGPVEGSHPVMQDPDLISDPRSGRIGPRWEGANPRCDTADPGGRLSG